MYWCDICSYVTSGPEYAPDDQFGFGEVMANAPDVWLASAKTLMNAALAKAVLAVSEREKP